MENLWMKNLKNIKPYVPGEQSNKKGIIKLNANENPYPPSPKAIKAIKEFDADTLRLYPDAGAYELKRAIADIYSVGEENVFLGNGSDDVLALAFQAFFNSDLPVAFPDLTYSFYPVWCSLFNIDYENYPVGEDFRIDPNDYRKPNGGVIIPNPNAPTSLGESSDFVRKIMDFNRDSVVIIDEAYVDFGAESVVPLTKEYENLLVTGTFSKSRSLAGLRIGFAIGSKKLISVLEAVKNSYNSYTLDSISISTAAASVRDTEYFEFTRKKIIATRERVTSELRKLGFTVLDSLTNFVFITNKNASMRDMFEYLKQKNIFIRYFSIARIENYARVTIGTDEQMNIFLDNVKEFLNEYC